MRVHVWIVSVDTIYYKVFVQFFPCTGGLLNAQLASVVYLLSTTSTAVSCVAAGATERFGQRVLGDFKGIKNKNKM